jgi:hypothetical protein
MKKRILVSAFLLCVFLSEAASAQAAVSRDREREHNCFDIESLIYDKGFRITDDARIRVRRGEVRVTPEDDFYHDRVIITENHELYINGDKIRLGRADKKLVKEYYELGCEVMDHAGEIGREGMKIGLEGAKLGVKAMANVFRISLDIPCWALDIQSFCP